MKAGQRKIEADVLLVPAADILLLSVFFIVISGSMLLVPAVTIQLPSFESGTLVSEDNPVVTLTPGGAIFLNGRKVSAEGLALILELSARLSRKKEEESVLVIRADQGVEYRDLLKIIEIAGEAGIHRVALATRRRPG